MRGTRVQSQLWAFVCLAVRHVLELLVLLARSDDANEIELLARRHEAAMLRRHQIPHGTPSVVSQFLDLHDTVLQARHEHLRIGYGCRIRADPQVELIEVAQKGDVACGSGERAVSEILL